ncbi:MAG: DUF1499 domain-containing protein [Oceanicaulis sp.]
MAERDFPLDFASLKPDTRPRRWLVLPPGFESRAQPDEESPVFQASPESVLEAFKAAALKAPRTTLTREDGGQIEVMQKSKVFKFRDYVTAAVAPAAGGAALCVYSRSVTGRYDFNVNRDRVRSWIDDTAARLTR